MQALPQREVSARGPHEGAPAEHQDLWLPTSTAAAECPAEEVQSKLKSLRQSSSSTTHHQGRFEGSDNFLTEAFKVWTVPYAVPYFTVYMV